MNWKMWLDDDWDNPNTPPRHPPKGFTPARSSQEAIKLTEQSGLPEFISFDHDLADGDDAMKYIDYLIENWYDGPIPEYQVHSENPVGKKNIISKMESWKRSHSL